MSSLANVIELPVRRELEERGSLGADMLLALATADDLASGMDAVVGRIRRDSGAAGGEYLSGVDWTKTRAYAFGLAGIYINQAGRESRGIVEAPDETARLRAEIAEKLGRLTDPARGGRSAIREIGRAHV